MFSFFFCHKIFQKLEVLYLPCKSRHYNSYRQRARQSVNGGRQARPRVLCNEYRREHVESADPMFIHVKHQLIDCYAEHVNNSSNETPYYT